MRVLLVDNYDSFTFNLYQLAAEIFGADILVVPNDTDWGKVLAERFDAAIISPGPGRPEREADFGISRRVLGELNIPTLGVCLGHQGICDFSGGVVRHAPEPMHGRLSKVHHDGSGLFRGIPSPYHVVRYHSLMGAEPLPDTLKKTAWTADGILMGVEHKSRPLWGVQFHPESISTQYGRELLSNFKTLAEEWWRTNAPGSSRNGVGKKSTSEVDSKPAAQPQRKALFSRRSKLTQHPTEIFEKLFAHEPYAFWLDSSLRDDGRARFSFMGGYSEKTVEGIRYYAPQRRVEQQKGPRFRVSTEDFFDHLQGVLAATKASGAGVLPFGFAGGLVGYLGYELKTLCGARSAHPSDHPDAYLLKVDRFLALDLDEGDLYTVALYDEGGDSRAAEKWCDDMAAKMAAPLRANALFDGKGRTSDFQPSQSHEEYLESIQKCLEAIRDGESYEVCLTNQLRAETNIPPFAYYKLLRERNPAPYATFLKFPELSVACSSPERFLTITESGRVETKPIKGTARRGVTHSEDEEIKERLEREEKSRSENLMICDLLRNDLGRVCEVGSVKVPRLMHVETYATVHQLVSTITGQLSKGQTSVDCLRAAFPGGSMTGAPKIRTMEIIDSLEKVARGIYSGAMGFISYSGAVDVNIVIRTAVFSGNQVTIGVGGAIVALSDPEEEWNEIRLKAHALLATFAEMSETAVDLELVENQVLGAPRAEEEEAWK